MYITITYGWEKCWAMVSIHFLMLFVLLSQITTSILSQYSNIELIICKPLSIFGVTKTNGAIYLKIKQWSQGFF